MARAPIKVAILDDYLDTAASHFQSVPDIDLTVFRDTLPAYSHPKTTDADRKALVDRLSPFQVLCTMRERTPFPKDLLQKLPNLKLLHCTGTQFNTFDMTAAKELGIVVAMATGKRATAKPSRTPQDITTGGQHPTTQHTWAMILALARNVAVDDRVVKTVPGGWQSGLATGLSGKTLGLVGLGRLGAAVARIGYLAWGMRIVCWSENLTQEKADKAAEGVGLPADIAGEKLYKTVSKKELFEQSDVVSVHYVLSERSRGVVGEQDLGAMKKSALFINTSRGPLVDEDVLLTVLENGQIKGAALDVFDIEPLPKDSPWRKASWGTEGRSQVLLTPHMGYVDEGVINAWYEETAENVKRWEARENEVEFSDEDDDPEVVSAMIQFAYKQQYDKPTKVNESMPFTVKLFIMADKREFPSLMAYTVLEMQALARGIVQGPIGIPEDNAFSRTVKLIYSATNDTEKYAKMLRQIAVEYAYKNNAALEDKDSGYTDVKNHADCFGNDLFEYSGEYSTTK
ncbi:MAG: hypothetical protein M1820_004176 [Bogoriella megaspora]|nr:MAG: hypothetical protein M1820_004176 [Bogoriella megaspora]